MPRFWSFLPLTLALLAGLGSAAERDPREALNELLADISSEATAPLLDRTLPIVPLAALNGSRDALELTPSAWRDCVFEVGRLWPGADVNWERLLSRDVRVEQGPIPFAGIFERATRLDPSALEDGRLEIAPGRVRVVDATALETTHVFAASPLASHTHRGEHVEFVFDRSLWITDAALPATMSVDFDDGRGRRDVPFGERIVVSWTRPGTKHLLVRLETSSGDEFVARSTFEVLRLGTPTPDDTLSVVASVPWQGIAGSGDAYVYLAETHTEITNPVLVIEGFDIDDSYYWEELYELLNQQNLLETLRADGYDSIVLNFHSATDPIQRNGLLAAELIAQIAAITPPEHDLFVIGASMGGLVGRYALCWMEQQQIDARTRTFLAFDAPHGGANIPLGIQHWVSFFSGLSSEAAFLLSRVNSPAARQLLAYHHTVAPNTTGAPDPLRAAFLADLAALGDWPSEPRLVAVVNGAGDGTDQGFAPGAQIISYVAQSPFLDITGNVWAVPDGTNTKIFDGELDYIIFPDQDLEVFVSGTLPYDNAPGGRRDSMAQMDAVEAPLGDILALHDNHCFIPTVAALSLATSDLFYDVDGDPNLVDLTPFDAIYVPSGPNQDHVEVTPDSAPWILNEILAGDATAAALTPPLTDTALWFAPPSPHPVQDATTLRFRIPAAARARASLYDVSGRRIATLLDESLEAGEHRLEWTRPGDMAAGVYFVEIQAGGARQSRRLVLTR